MRNCARFVYLGAPGVGKGTYADIIVRRSNGRWAHLSPGAFIRAEIAAKSNIGITLDSYVLQGKLVPDSLLAEHWLPRMAAIVQALDLEASKNPSQSYGVILDGYPRTVEQCHKLETVVSPEHPFLAIDVTLRRDIAMMKLMGRCHCRLCGGNYNTEGIVDEEYHMPPIPPKQTCPKSPTGDPCSASLEKRSDDSESIIAARLAEHDRNMAPVLDFYRQRGRLATMDIKKGIQDVDKLWTIMMDKFQSSQS